MKTLGHPVCPFNLNHRISSSYSCIEVSCFSLPRKSFEMTLSPNVWSGNSCQSNYVLYFSILNFDKTELCLVNAQGMFWRKKKNPCFLQQWMNELRILLTLYMFSKKNILKTILWLLPQHVFFPEISREIGKNGNENVISIHPPVLQYLRIQKLHCRFCIDKQIKIISKWVTGGCQEG